tara:strand:- start:314 stop:706 length:393 start_codon:yes stop_codon:yes gene_type:complete
MSSNDIDYFDEGFDDEIENKKISNNIIKMSNYKVTQYTKNKAKGLGVIVKPSTNAKKKIDVFKKEKDKDGKMVLKKIVSIGDPNYKDFPTYMKEDGKEVANKRRKLYKIRHNKHRKNKGSRSWWADNLLW